MSEQMTMNFGSQAKGPVTCLGMTFENDAARREHFTRLLADKLKDPEFRRIEGFPIGNDEDILALSDPPYYCACPNPWIDDFVKEWEAAKPPKPMGYRYAREPFAADVSEGKNDPIYNAHSYHTKVPHKAIMRYILHYTEPGDIVFDGFCGTGMTGVAAQMCGNIEQVRSLGYTVDETTGEIRDPKGEDPKKVISHLGTRKAVLNDLSPAATFIAYNYNTPVDVDAFEAEAKRILKEVEDECGWMYETQHVNKDGKPVLGVDGKPVWGTIEFSVWSDVYNCPYCANEFVFWRAAADENGQVRESFECPHCHAILNKRKAHRTFISSYDNVLNETISIAKQIPVLEVYSYQGKRYSKYPDEVDMDRISKIEQFPVVHFVPSGELPEGFNTSQPKLSHGLKCYHQFYTKRNLQALSCFWGRINESCLKLPLRQMLLGSLRILSKHAKHNKERRVANSGFGWVNAGVTGTLYVSSCPAEQSVLFYMKKRISKYGFTPSDFGNVGLSCESTTKIGIPEESIDYVFLDPPFGANLNYSELNSVVEAWIGVSTNNREEAIENSTQKKGLYEYGELMTNCLSRVFKLLKPGGWLTVEFSNSNASVWNCIQDSLSNAGFVVASVSILDKQIGTFKAVTTPVAMKEDLVISAYKPDENFEARFKIEGETESGVWDFVRTHLGKLPVCKFKDNRLGPVQERDPRLLYDQVVSFFVRRNLNVPISAKEFQLGLAQKFSERDGLYFLPEQVAEYDKKKDKADAFDVQGELFVCDEASAISWLRAKLKEKPQTYAGINPDFMQQLSAWNKHETLPELRMLLDENFLCYDGNGPVPPQIHTYLSTNYHDLRSLEKDDPKLVDKATDLWYVPDPNNAADMEKKREKALLKEFESYRAEKKLKKFRLEVVRAGFKKAFADKDFATILAIGEKIPEDVINEDNKLLMWYNIAQRLGIR